MQRFKKDKKFRLWVVAIGVILVMVWVNGSEEKKEAQSFETCNQFNSFSLTGLFESGWDWEDGSHHWWGVSGDQITLCKTNNCIVAEVVIAGAANPEVCVPYALNGWIVQNVDSCKSGCSEVINDDIVCRQCKEDEEPEICNSREESIGKILGGIFPSLGCKSRYYITLFGGGFMALMMFMAVM